MVMTFIVHIVAGTVGLISGFLALSVTKGAALHRQAGMVFVFAMLTMCTAGLILEAVRMHAPAANFSGALITAYLVTTGLTTVHPVKTGSQWIHIGGMLLVIGVAVYVYRKTRPAATTNTGTAPVVQPSR